MKRLIFIAAALCTCSPASPISRIEAELSAPTFVQVASAVPQPPTASVTVSLSRAQAAGHLLVVMAGWNDTTAAITSVTDTRGDGFALAIGPTTQAGGLSQSIYYARNIAAGSNSVRVTFSPAASSPDIRVAEYAGADTVAPLDSAAGASGSSETASAAITTHGAAELLVAGTMVLTGSQAGSGWTSRVVTSPDGDVLEDRSASSAGSYGATASVYAPNGWVIQAAAFLPAATGGAGGNGGTGGAGGAGGASGAGGAAGAGAAGGTGGAAGAGGGAGGAGGAAGGPPDAGRDAPSDGACTATYPLRADPSNRYLVTPCGVPFLVAGDSPQCLSANLSPANMDAYFAARAAQGFNAAWVNLLCNTYTGGRADASTYDGITPFAGHSDDVTHPNAAYFTRMDTMVAKAAAHGIVLFLDPMETGGFLSYMQAAGASALRTYGQFLGGRYRSAANVVWMSGNDYSPTSSNDTLVKAIALGIQDVAGAVQIQTLQTDWPAAPSTLDDSAYQPPFCSINLSYTYNPTYALIFHDYDRTPHLPNVMVEANYEGENNEGGPHLTNAHDVRTQYYWSNLSGASGSFYGNHWEVFLLDNSTWSSRITGDQGAPQMLYVQQVFGAVRWWQLVPDEAHAVMTAGMGSDCMASTEPQGGRSPNAQDNGCAVAARTPDGTLIMAYMPTPRTITIDMTGLAGRASARWFDPTTGAYQTVAGSPFANAGSRGFTPPVGNHADSYADWVLVLSVP
jgi:hypothetical protein